MPAFRFVRPAVAAAVLAAAVSAALPAAAQSVAANIPVGSGPESIAVNPITNKIYVGNSLSDNVTIINGANNSTTTVAAGDYPGNIAINHDTGNVYVSNILGATVTVLNGTTNAVLDTLNTGGAGWTAIDPLHNRAYVIRYGGADEFNTITGLKYELTSATRSFQPVSIVVNPVTQRAYIAHLNTGDVVGVNVANPIPYPPLLCPNGSGGFRPQPADPPPPPAPDPGVPPCIDVPGAPVAVAVNPVTGRAYSVNNGTTNQVSVISPTDHSIMANLTVAGATGGKTIAVNPINNKIYVAFARHVVVVDGSNNSQTVIPTGSAAGGPAAIGIDVIANTVYVPNKDGTLLVIDGATNANSTIAIPAGALAIGVNPLTHRVYVTHDNNTVTVVDGVSANVATGLSTSITPLSGDLSASSGSIQINASSSMTPAPLNAPRRVYFRIDGGAWTLATGTGPFSANYTGLSMGSHTLEAFATNGLDSPSINTDLANVPILGNLASYSFTVGAVTAPTVSLSPTTVDFGGQSMGTTSPGQTVTVTNSGSGTLTISNVTTSAQFSQTNDCGSLAAGASCTITVRFTPAASGGVLNSTVDVTGSLSIVSNAASSPNQVTLNGVAEKSLVTHYYLSILGRTPDAGGKSFWQGEAKRVSDLGANVNEAWFAMAQAFYGSAEYAAFNRDTTGFVTDLYRTFFNREPDSGGLSHWTGQMAGGMPREVVLAAFMFSQEFANFTQAIFGNTAARAEVDVVGDFYRGLLSRLPDNGGFAHWVAQFRSAQCQTATAVRTQAESISSQFALSAEYAARARSNAQYVGDLYNSFLRRGGDLDGVNFWIGQINSGAMTREAVRQQFVASPEFSGRVQAVIDQGCLQ